MADRLLVSRGHHCGHRGSLTGLRRVFVAQRDGMAMASDRADVLAAAIQAGMGTEALALRLLNPLPPPPLAEQSMWRGVQAVAPDSYLELTPAQAPRVTRWWHPPEPAAGLREGAGLCATQKPTPPGRTSAAAAAR